MLFIIYAFLYLLGLCESQNENYLVNWTWIDNKMIDPFGSNAIVGFEAELNVAYIFGNNRGSSFESNAYTNPSNIYKFNFTSKELFIIATQFPWATAQRSGCYTQLNAQFIYFYNNDKTHYLHTFNMLTETINHNVTQFPFTMINNAPSCIVSHNNILYLLDFWNMHYYDWTTLMWTHFANVNTPHNYPACIGITNSNNTNKLFIAGGHLTTPTIEYITVNDHIEGASFDVNRTFTLSNASIKYPFVPKHIVFNDLIYFIGGWDNIAYVVNAVQIYDTMKDTIINGVNLAFSDGLQPIIFNTNDYRIYSFSSFTKDYQISNQLGSIPSIANTSINNPTYSAMTNTPTILTTSYPTIPPTLSPTLPKYPNDCLYEWKAKLNVNLPQKFGRDCFGNEINGTIHIVGGLYNPTNVIKFHISTQTFSIGALIPTNMSLETSNARVYAGSVTQYGDTIYFFRNSDAIIHTYNLLSETFQTNLFSLPHPLSYGCIVYDNYNMNNFFYLWRYDAYYYNSTNSTWISISSTNVNQYYPLCFQFTNSLSQRKLFVISSTQSVTIEYMNTSNIYDIVNNVSQWTIANAILPFKAHRKGFVYNDNIYLIGGSFARTNVFIYDTIQDIIYESIPLSIGQNRQILVFSQFNQRIYSISGVTVYGDACYQYSNIIKPICTMNPTVDPTIYPSINPSIIPTYYPTHNPITSYPTNNPTLYPTMNPTSDPIKTQSTSNPTISLKTGSDNNINTNLVVIIVVMAGVIIIILIVLIVVIIIMKNKALHREIKKNNIINETETQINIENIAQQTKEATNNYGEENKLNDENDAIITTNHSGDLNLPN